MTTFVIDAGQSLLRVGSAGEDAPSYLHPRSCKAESGIESAQVIDFDRFGASLAEGINDVRRGEEPGAEALLSIGLYPTRSEREGLLDLMFTTLGFDSLGLAPAVALSLMASGRTTGLVVDFGEDTTRFAAIGEGEIAEGGKMELHVGGSHLTNFLMNSLNEGQGHSFSGLADRQVIRWMKEEFGRTWPTRGLANSSCLSPEEEAVGVDLPDGSRMELGIERYFPPEPLFDPSLLGISAFGVPLMINSVAMRAVGRETTTRPLIRPDMYSNIVFAGRGSLFPGLDHRVRDELAEIISSSLGKPKVVAPPERGQGAWIGGSILASLPRPTATESYPCCVQWITKEEYTESGASVLK